MLISGWECLQEEEKFKASKDLGLNTYLHNHVNTLTLRKKDKYDESGNDTDRLRRGC